MRIVNVFKVGLLLIAANLIFTSCGKDDEKEPELVPDPIEEAIEYYISGKVVTENAPLSGVTVTTGDATATTDAEGLYTVTVKDKKTYAVSFTKEGYMDITDATAEVTGSATNRSIVTLNVTMSPKGQTTNVDPNKETIATENGESGVGESTVAVVIPEGTLSEEAEITVTPYVPATTSNTNAGTTNEAIAMSNIAIESSKEITTAKDVTLAFTSKATDSSHFDEVEVYKKAPGRAAGDWTSIGNAVYDPITNSDQAIIPANSTLNGEYSIRVASSKTVSASKSEVTTDGGIKSNAGNMDAIMNYSFTYEAKGGWDYVGSISADINEGMAEMIRSTIAAQEGGMSGFYTISKTETTNISGDHIFYYSSKSVYVEKEYTFKVNGSAVTVKVQHYIGMELIYKNEPSTVHSGGTIG